MAQKIQKTNVCRLLDAAGIAYELIEYAVDESDLSATHVAEQLGEDVDTVFKTIVLEGDKTKHFVCVVPAASSNRHTFVFCIFCAISMSSHKLPFGLVFKEAAVIPLFLIHRLLLLRYVLVICHKICFAITAHASASARAWWWFVIS